MILFPAIDLKDGQCVRLKLGEMDAATVFNDDPAAQALAFEQQGFKYLHIVDLNGAFAGKPVNAAAVEAILKAITMPAQLGGGIRDLATIEMWLDKGIRRVILGTIAVRDPALVKEAAKRFPGRVAVGIDAKGGKVAVEGWAETSELTAVDLAKRFEDAGAAAIIYTDIERDGVLKGLNLPATAALARSTRSRSLRRVALPPSPTYASSKSRITPCSKARSPAAPSMMGASIPGKHFNFWKRHENW